MVEDSSLTDFVDDEDDAPGDDTPVDATESDDEEQGDEAESDDGKDGDETASTDGREASDDAGESPTDDDGRASPASVEPATVTAAWSPGGDECSACGTVVSYRWHSESGLVCPDCKEW